MECDVFADGVRLENLNIWGVFWTKQVHMEAECCRKAASGRRVASSIKSLVNARDLQLQFARALHETLLVPILMYGRDNVMEREKKI